MKIKIEKKVVIMDLDRIETFNMLESLIATLKQTEITDSHCCFIDHKNNKELLIKINK